jgi:hypothetical protein
MSPFIESMPSLGLMLSPPESNVMPLPMRATDPRGVPAGVQRSSRNRGSMSEPRFTPSRPPISAASMSALSSTVTSNP